MKVRYRIILSVLVVLFLGGYLLLQSIQSNMETLEEAEIAAVDLAALDDGIYTGEFSLFPISVTVEVTVADGSIKAADIIRQQSGPGYEADAMIDRMIEAQSLQVDVVSGATYSSKAFLKAVANALQGPPATSP